MSKLTENDLMKAIKIAEDTIRDSISDTNIQEKGISAFKRLENSLLDEDREFLMLDIALDADLLNHFTNHVLYNTLGGKNEEDIQYLLQGRDVKDYITDLIDEFLLSLIEQDFFKSSNNIFYSKNPNLNFKSDAKFKEQTVTSVFSKDRENHINVPKDSSFQYDDTNQYGKIKQRSGEMYPSVEWRNFSPYEKTDSQLNLQNTNILNHIRTIYCNFMVFNELIDLFPPIFKFIVKLGQEAPQSLQFSSFVIYPIGTLSNLNILKQKKEKQYEDKWEEMKLAGKDKIYQDLYKDLNLKDKRNNLSLQNLSKGREDISPNPIIMPYTQKGSLEQKARIIQPSEISPVKPIDIDQKLTGKFLSHWRLK